MEMEMEKKKKKKKMKKMKQKIKKKRRRDSSSDSSDEYKKRKRDDDNDGDEEAVEDWNRVVNKYKALRTCVTYLIGITHYLISLSVVRCHLYSKMFSWVKLKKKKKKLWPDSPLKATVAAQI